MFITCIINLWDCAVVEPVTLGLSTLRFIHVLHLRHVTGIMWVVTAREARDLCKILPLFRHLPFMIRFTPFYYYTQSDPVKVLTQTTMMVMEFNIKHDS